MGNGQQKSCSSLPQVLMIGLDGAGKTTVLHKFKQRINSSTAATIGFNVETISPNTERTKNSGKDSKTKSFSFTLWDVGGQGGANSIRHLWEHHLTSQEFQGIIYVIDSSDRERLLEAQQELFTRVLQKPQTQGLPLVVIANKQDLKDALPGHELATQLGLTRHLAHPWYIHEVSAKTGQGLSEALDRIYSLIEKPVGVPTSRFYP